MPGALAGCVHEAQGQVDMDCQEVALLQQLRGTPSQHATARGLIRETASVPGRTAACSWRTGAKVALLATGLLLVGTALARRAAFSASARAQWSDPGAATREFQIAAFPQDCSQAMKFNGCKKDAWTCDSKQDFSMGYKCCCEDGIWDSHIGPPVSHTTGGPTVLKFSTSDEEVCLGGPEDDDGKHFTTQPCDSAQARVKLPPQGAGPIQLLEHPGKCLGVKDSDVKVVWCNFGAPAQMFQLTNGGTGMLQWSHGGDKCLDVEGGKVKAGRRIVLGSCVYWPKKPSQQFAVAAAPKPKGGEDKVTHPSLFCLSLMLPWTYEVDMMRSHIKRGCGIFECDAWAVFSNKTVKLKDGATPDEDVYSDVMNGTLKAEIGGKFKTALNTPVFRRFWQRVIDDGRVWTYDWTIKVDPDAVFFPHRLKEMLKNEYKPHGQPGAAVWLNNCQLGLHGPIEVFSKQALGAYKDGAVGHGACDKIAKKHGQEDVFMRYCMEKLKIPKIDAFNLLLESEWACNERPSSSSDMPPCFDRQVAFHPFKSVESYFHCYDKGVKMHWNAPLYFNGVPPSAYNHHHA
mmetsp:Transcript_36310/g.113115  ORF Transcript_36310/g.113115 Transcript_36310/m.113115 type:complete len:571 (+) Transcript_36310:75-1787(+)